MKSSEFVAKLKNIATNYKTAYIWGGIGALITKGAVADKVAQYSKNRTAGFESKALALVGKNAFMFDCVGIIKSVLWGWSGSTTKSHGGAKYASNGVPDINADTMITKCSGVTTNFSKVEVGEALWTNGHIGVYIGDGLAVECTPSFKGGVQITAVGNIGAKSGYYTRTWKKHGKLPYVDYTENVNTVYENAKRKVKTKAGLSDSTMTYLEKYRYGEDLIIKLANAMK